MTKTDGDAVLFHNHRRQNIFTSGPDRGAARILRSVHLGFVLLLVTCGAALAEYRLQRGDAVRVAIESLGDAPTESRIDVDGNLNVRWFGSVPAAGRTLAELLSEIRRRADGQVIKRYTFDGQLFLIEPEPREISVEIVDYRPVIVSGDVARPGEVAFRPGLTVRGAVALAGGAQEMAEDDMIGRGESLRWQNEYGTAALDHAVARLRLWRLTSELQSEFDSQPPPAEELGMSERVVGSLLEEQQRLLEISRESLEGQRAFLERALEQARDRVLILREQRGNLEAVLAEDRDEEERMNQLLESGLTMASRQADAKRATMFTATRLLDLEDNLARAELEVTRLTRARSEFEETRASNLLLEREAARLQLMDTGRRIDSISRMLTAEDISVASAGLIDEPEVIITLYRREPGGIETVAAAFDDDLLPGDTIEVTVTPVDLTDRMYTE